MLRIAQCTDSFLPVKDGVGRISFEYARALGERGHDCCVITPMVNAGFRGRYPFEILDFVSVPQVASVPQVRMGMAALDLHYLARADSLPFDVIHTHSPGVAGMEAVRLADKLRVPLIGTFHQKYFDSFFPSGADQAASAVNARFLLDYYGRCDEVWVASEEGRALLLSEGLDCDIQVFENGAEFSPASVQDVARARRAFHLSDAPLLLYVGRLEKMKNLPRILGAARLLKNSGVEFQLAFAGQGPEEASAKALALELDLMDRVRFLGHVSDTARLGALYAAASLCLFPYRSVGAGMVVREAAVQGTPSLVMAGASSSDRIQNGVNGLTCADTPESMAEAIAGYLAEPAAIVRLGDAARDTIPVFWADVMDRAAARYEALAGMDRTALKRKRGFFRKELQQMDQTLEKRTLDLMLKFLRQDTQHLYAYPHRPCKSLWPALPDPSPLPRSTPEAEGLSSESVRALAAEIDADRDACAQQMLLLRHGKVIFEACWAPYEPGTPHQLYSLSKSVTGTAIGMLADEGRLSVDEKLDDIFFDKVPEDPAHPAHSMTVRHLLNMSTGSLFNEVGSALGADWEREFLNALVKFPPGSRFDYNSMNTYMLSAVVRRKTGQTVTEYLTPRLFKPLGIPAPVWDVSPSGTEKGGWGLNLTAESVAKIGQLYLNGGVWTVDGTEKRLLSRDWIQAATRPGIDTPNGEITYGYGRQMWMTSHPGAFLFNGAFGQYMLALPDRDAIVVLFSGTARLFAQGGVMDAVERAFADASDGPLAPNRAGENALAVTKAGLTVRCRQPYFEASRERLPMEELTRRLDGRVYQFEKNTAGLFPVVLMNVTNNYTVGLQRAAFRREKDGRLRLELSEGDSLHRLTLLAEGYTPAAAAQQQDTYELRCSIQTEALTETEWALHVNVHFIETPFTRVLHFLFKGDGVILTLDEQPTVQAASEMLLTLTGISRAQAVRTLMPLLKRERLQHTLRTFTTATLQGKL